MSRPKNSGYVLMVDDDPDDQFLFKGAFLSHNPQVDLVIMSDSVEALDYLNHCEVPPVLMVLDFNMPKMNGSQLIQHIKSSPLLCDIPVVILSTAKLGHEDCLKHGAKQCYQKPSTNQELIALVGEILSYYMVLAQQDN